MIIYSWPSLPTLFAGCSYSTMCGHGVIALGRYAVDYGIVPAATGPETEVRIECPCGLVVCHVETVGGRTGAVRFWSVPAFTVYTGKLIR